MKKLIDKSALVAEIDRRIKVLQKHPYESHVTICHLDSLKQSLDTLEVKEVDLEKEISNWRNNHYHKKFYKLEGYTSHYTENSTILDIAKHFFELGLKTKSYGQPYQLLVSEIPTRKEKE